MIIQIKYISLSKGMTKALKKNQIVIFAIALMLITAGYLNYSMNTEQTAEVSATGEQMEYAGIGDAKLVSSENVNNEVNNIEKQQNANNVANQKNENKNSQDTSTVEYNDKTIETSNATNQTEDLDAYFEESRLERDKMYSEMLSTNQSILSAQNVSAEQKNAAQNQILNINKQKNAIMIAENLIKNKGFKDIIIFVNDKSVSVVVRKDKVEEAEIAQIQSIIQRELSVNIENIHISNK